MCPTPCLAHARCELTIINLRLAFSSCTNDRFQAQAFSLRCSRLLQLTPFKVVQIRFTLVLVKSTHEEFMIRRMRVFNLRVKATHLSFDL